MPSLKILKAPNPILSQPCSEVDDVDWQLKKTFREMIRLMKKVNGYAIAANQVGISQRFFVADTGSGPMIVVNPEYEVLEIPDDPNEFTFREGCLSVPGRFWAITRPDTIQVSYFNEDGKYIEGILSGLDGRVFQHEIDHLNGKLLFEAMPETQKHEAIEDVFNSAQQPIEAPQQTYRHPYTKVQAHQTHQR